jgi:hypothetical protein
MSAGEIYKAWALLLGLSFATTALTLVGGMPASFTAGLLLALSGLKARIILSRYLDLHHSTFWMRLFGTAIGVFLIAAFVLCESSTGRAG